MSEVQKMFCLMMDDPETGEERTIVAKVNGHDTLMVASADQIDALMQLGPQIAKANEADVSLIAFDRVSVDHVFQPPEVKDDNSATEADAK